MTFTETDSYVEFVKWRTSSDPTTNKAKKIQSRLRICQKHEKSEVPDIIEGVPVCSGDHVRQTTRCKDTSADSGRVVFQIPDEPDRQNRAVTSVTDSKRSSRSSNASSSCSDRSSRSSGYGTDQRQSHDENCYERSESECRLLKEDFCWEEDQDDSSACSDSSLTDFTFDDEGKWHCPPKLIWKATVEAIHEFNMIRPGDKVLICLSGGTDSIALLHTIHQYQFYARSKGIHFSIGALFVHEDKSEVDPLHLMAYCRTLGVKLIYQDKLEDIESEGGIRTGRARRSLQSWANHGVRRRAYAAARAHGYSVAALAQSLDAAARAFLAALFHSGALAALKAHYRVKEHDIRIIRPFIYVRSRSLAAFARARMLPDFRGRDVRSPPASPTRSDDDDTKELGHMERSISEPCGSTEKQVFTQARRSLDEPLDEALDPLDMAHDLLGSQERIHPYLFSSLKSALHPLISARKDLKENRHRKRSVIQMKNGAPVYDSEEGTEEEPVP